MKTRVVLGLIALAAAVCTGCSYAVNDVFRRDIRTIYVEFFDNQTFRRGLEVSLTEAVQKEIRLRTPFTFAPRDEADSILSGELLDFQGQTHVKTEDDRLLIKKVSVRVRFEWRERLTGRPIVPEQTISESTRVAASVEETLFLLAFEEAAQRIVENMQKNW